MPGLKPGALSAVGYRENDNMAVPKKKKSKSKRDSRRAHDRVSLPQVAECPHCQEPVLPHRVCSECGTYKGKEIIKEKES